MNAGPRENQWKQVQEAINKGLPRTAITNLEPILQGALKDGAFAEATKALAQKITLEGNIQGNRAEEKITRLEAQIPNVPRPMVPMLDTILAHWYWQYFQQNRWRFVQRTATAAPPRQDFTTWDLPRLFSRIDAEFQKALAAQDLLKATPVNSWDDLLQKGTMPDSYRPTLYDFIAHEALDFYTSGEQAAAKPEDAFELSADSPVLDSVEKFLAWKPDAVSGGGPRPGPEGEPLVLKAVRLFQELLRFHQNDPSPKLAFADADLGRLVWAGNTAFGEDKQTRYKAGLERFSREYADFEISALAIYQEARVLQQQEDLVGARQLALRAAQIFPESPGGKLCHNLVSDIESKSAAIETERVWNCFDQSRVARPAPEDRRDACPAITVRYRNVDRVYFRALAYDYESVLKQGRNLHQEIRELARAQQPALAWSEALPPTSDYKEKTISLNAPTSLKPGFYVLVASHDPGFAENENQVSLTEVWVSDLSLVTRVRAGKAEGFLLDANSGEPIPDAAIEVWRRPGSTNFVLGSTLQTDTNGYFGFKPPARESYVVRALHQGRQLTTQESGGWYPEQVAPRPTGQTIFFTDRSIYRPGQTIQYKGICLWVNQAKDNYELLKGEQVTVIFADQNGKTIARQNHRANDFGSFAGSFTAPGNTLLGQFHLYAQGRAAGETWVRVEEYKRPKFEVILDAPETAARLQEKVTLLGHATSYTGAAIDGAQVSYHVVRQVRMPPWWGWWRPSWQGESQEIAHGTAQTETDGSFKIEFTAMPDLKVPESDEPTFNFQVNADVTDSAGETRSAEKSIRVGYTALEATLTADEWETEDKPVLLNLQTRSLDDEPQVAEGTVKVHALQPPETVVRAPLSGPRYSPYRRFAGYLPEPGESPEDLSDPNNWPLGKVVAEAGFTSDTNGAAKLEFKLPVGAYRAILETQDRFGKKVTAKLPIRVLRPEDNRLAIRIPHLLSAPAWEVQPGDEFMALWGTGYASGPAYIEIEHRARVVQAYWTKPGQTQQQVRVAVTEAMRGGFTLHVTQVRENRAYLDSHRVDVPWKNKELELQWEHFVSKLQPGQKETWTLKVRKPNRERGSKTSAEGGLEQEVAELMAALYDESLDAFAPHTWIERFHIFRRDASGFASQFANYQESFEHLLGSWRRDYQPVEITYRSLPAIVGGPGPRSVEWLGRADTGLYRRFGALQGGLGGARNEMLFQRLTADGVAAAKAPAVAAFAGALEEPAAARPAPAMTQPAAGAGPKPDLGQVTARKNLQETAFFFPQLTSHSNGMVQVTFTMPEALTKWRFMGFAHDRSLRSGYLEDHAVTAKDLMAQPNPPRFLREGDTVEFTVKVSNQSEKPQSGTVRLTFDNAFTGQSADRLLEIHPTGEAATNSPRTEQSFTIPAKQSRTFAWRISVPDGCGFLTYKAVAAGAHVSDGEEGAVPVLSRSILVTESLPLPIRGPATKKFEFGKLLKSAASKSLQNQSLTVQMVSRPAWYAVLALPYLMEYPYECSEQIFNRLYANALARTIANSDPKIRRVFDQWKNTPALQSPLEKNQELKSVALEETPWLREAQSESQARKNVGLLFDENRLNYETERALSKLMQMQLGDGSWPWFPGGERNEYITLYITTGFGRLRHLGVDIQIAPAVRAWQRLDAWVAEEYQRIQERPAPEKYVPSPTDALYLYGRSFFLKDQAIAPGNRKAVDFLLAQARKFWLDTGCRQTQAQLALALQRFAAFGSATDATPAAILKSLKERSVSSEEMGMFWRDTELSWWWYRAPIETQALMIEAFDEIMHDEKSVEDCRVWLLKQKQTQDWKTTKATADAVYALLLRGKDLLSGDALVDLKLGGLDVTPKEGRTTKSEIRKTETTKSANQIQPEPGTGFYEVRFVGKDIKPKFGEITVKKLDPGVAWGSVTWQYLEDMGKVTPYEGTPLRLNKALFIKKATSRGPVLEPLKAAAAVGDELVVRIELRVDRDMEYVHLKDQRGSGTEPVNVLSEYKWQDGLSYYESTRDTASHFFIDYLRKGTYVFEYSTRIQLRGQYQTGLAEIQCMYAPEFNSHSQSIPLVVR